MTLEHRLLQGVVAIACLLPLLVGGQGIVHGPAPFGHLADVPRDLDSHFRYISGIFFATGLGFLSCIPHIETKGPRFRLLGALIGFMVEVRISLRAFRIRPELLEKMR